MRIKFGKPLDAFQTAVHNAKIKGAPAGVPVPLRVQREGRNIATGLPRPVEASDQKE